MIDFTKSILGVITISTFQNGGKNFGDGYNINQRWYIEQTTPNEGFLEVKIWTKVSVVFILSFQKNSNTKHRLSNFKRGP